MITHESIHNSPSLLSEYFWYDKLWGPSQRVVTLFELSDKTGTLTRNEMVLKMWVRDGHVCSVEEVLYPFVHSYLFVCVLFDCLFSCLFDLGEGRPMAMSVPLKRLFSSLFIFTTFYVLFVSCFANVFLDFVGEGRYQK